MCYSDDLSTGNYEDSGEIYSCIIWIQDVEIEKAVEAGIDEAEMTRTSENIEKRSDYSYDICEVDGLTYIDVEFDENESDEYVQTYIEAEREAAVELYIENNNSFVAQNFMTRDMSIAYISKYSPCIFADLTITKVVDLIEKDEVRLIESYSEKGADEDTSIATLALSEIEENVATIRADIASDYFSVTGEGVKIGQIEDLFPDDSTVIRNSELSNATSSSIHASNVHLIMSQVAPDATYYATSIRFEDFFEQVEWLLDQGVNIINMSAWIGGGYNTYNVYARWIDHVAYNHNVHFVKSAGNVAETGVTTPGMAYNIITVGLTEKDSPHDIYIETSEKGSSYTKFSDVSLANQVANKPDVMAPGEYSNDWGTSYATPLVAGTIALMCEYKPALKTQQHIVKAILAATTGKVTHNHHYVLTDDEFEQYGAGIIDARSAIYAIYKGNYSSSTGTLTNVADTKTYNMKVTSSDTCMRIAVAHANRIEFDSSEEHSENYPDNGTIGVIGISIYNPDGDLVKSTVSYTSIRGINLQVIEFDPRGYGTGTYTIEVFLREAASGGRSTNFGVAWR